jgi:thioredoxin 1
MPEDEELEELRQKKLEELMHQKQAEPASPAAGATVEVTDQNLAETVSRQGLIVVDCWAAWCSPCRMLSPIVEELARDYAGKILFGKLNVDENPRVALEYQILSIPTLLVFKDGKLVDRMVGVMPRRLLEPKITQHL